jgi:hypothetical protein
VTRYRLADYYCVDGNSIFVQNVSNDLPNYTVSCPKKTAVSTFTNVTTSHTVTLAIVIKQERILIYFSLLQKFYKGPTHLASLAREGPKMEPGSRFPAHPTQLVHLEEKTELY